MLSTTSVSIRLSILSPHYQEQLREILDSVGVALPSRPNQSVVVKFFGSEEIRGRARSVTPSGRYSRRRVRSATSRDVVFGDINMAERTTHGPAGDKRNVSGADHYQDVQAIRAFFPSIGGFKFLSNWRPKKYLLSKLLGTIESFYESAGEGLQRSSVPFTSCFQDALWQYFQERLGLRSLVEFSVLDLLVNCVEYRKACMEVDVFLRFAEGFYGGEDYGFFSQLRKSMRFWTTANMDSMSETDCQVLAEKLFASDRIAVKAVMDTLRSGTGNVSLQSHDDLRGMVPHQKTQKSFIESSYFVYISLWVFHHSEGKVPEKTSPAANSVNSTINNYVDSILALKKSTAKSLAENPSLVGLQKSSSLLRDSVQMEEVVAHMLRDCCVQLVGSADPTVVKTADALMQAVMIGDEKRWREVSNAKFTSVSGSNQFRQCLDARDSLLSSIGSANASDAEIEDELYKFCCRVVQTDAVKRKAGGVAISGA